MDLELAQRHVLITGGTAGLGLALARRVIGEGAKVTVCGRDQARLDNARQLLVGDADSDGAVLAVPCDVRDPVALDHLVEVAFGTFGPIDGLVNNAGAMAACPFEDITDAQWESDFDLKVMAAVRLIRRVMPSMRERATGSILNVLSIGAKAPTARSMPSSVSRGAGLALTKALAHEVAPHGIRVNAICVGFVESDQWSRLGEQTGTPVGEVLDHMVKDLGIPLGRVGRSDEFADLGAFLLSPRSSYITGVAVNVDGGLSPVT